MNGARRSKVQSGIKLNENTEGSIEGQIFGVGNGRSLAEFEGPDREVQSNLLCQLER